MRKLATAAISFSAAIILSQYLVPTSWGTYCCLFFTLLSCIGLFFKTDRRLQFFLISIGLAVGFLWSSVYACVFYKPALALDGRSETVSATVCREPDITEYGSKVLVMVKVSGSPRVKTQLYIYGRMPDVRPGNRIEFTARFRTAETIHGEKTETFLSRGIFLLANVKGDVTITDDTEPITFFPVRTAHALSQIITQIFPKNTAAFMRALILGDTSEIYKDTVLSGALSTTGTSHIISVSGMNIAFLMGFMGLIIKNKRVLTAVGIPVILIFISVVGFMPPIVRAGVMQIFLLSAPIFKRESDTVTALSAALLLILLCNPYAAGSAGLQLSFSATLGIVLLTKKIYTALDEPLQNRKFYKHRFLKVSFRFVIGSLATTVGALILSIPLIALHFGTVSLIAPLTNLLILWAVTLAFCGGIIAVLIGFIYMPLGSVLAWIVSLPAGYIIKTIELFAQVTFASVYTSNPAIVLWLVYIYILLIAVFAYRMKRRQLLLPVCLSVITLCLILVLTSIFSDNHALSITALDVGQGQSIVVTSGKYTAVIDCGSSSGKDAGDILAKHLQSHGRTTIDLLILTHYHTDHANGVLGLLARMPVSAIALPDPSIDDGALAQEIQAHAFDSGIRIVDVTSNLRLSFDDAEINLYAPLGGNSENERGLSVLCSENRFDALITGDMKADIERRLLETAQLPDIELLIVGHHGSKHSTSGALLETLRPETAVISVGYNTYGHPSPETIHKLHNAGIAVYRTDESGNITINGW